MSETSSIIRRDLHPAPSLMTKPAREGPLGKRYCFARRSRKTQSQVWSFMTALLAAPVRARAAD